jgi:hypothetical protein
MIAVQAAPTPSNAGLSLMARGAEGNELENRGTADFEVSKALRVPMSRVGAETLEAP